MHCAAIGSPARGSHRGNPGSIFSFFLHILATALLCIVRFGKYLSDISSRCLVKMQVIYKRPEAATEEAGIDFRIFSFWERPHAQLQFLKYCCTPHLQYVLYYKAVHYFFVQKTIHFHPTTRIPNSCSSCCSCVTPGSKRAIIDLLVSKRTTNLQKKTKICIFLESPG